MPRLLLISSILLAAAILTLGCNLRADEHDHSEHDKAAAPTSTIVEIAAGDARFSTLVSAVTSAGLVETLSGKGPFTVFAPTNDAFAKLPEGTLEALSTEQLTAILTYHVLAGAVPASEAVKLDGQQATTVNGAPITITVVDGAVKINDAQVIIADIKASNGVIHVIDSVILPPAE
ncbi:MAG: fasciclin domain-containing protein [Planctomycetota bacterium]|nr:MAG: fasciclin domain-containing protein [Planctomycetota bacterium]